MKLILVDSDNYSGVLFTERAYRELTLQMSTGDFHSHSACLFTRAYGDMDGYLDLDPETGEFLEY